jgi:hypothetical protein
MKFLCADAELGAEAKFVTVGEAGGGIHEHRRRIDLLQKASSFVIIGRNNALGKL